MKTIKYISTILSLAIAMFYFSACEDTDELVSPVIQDFSADQTNITAGTKVVFAINAEADYLVFWAGTEGSVYDEGAADLESVEGVALDSLIRFKPENSGKSIADTSFTYIYQDAGVYSAVMVATNTQNFTGATEQVVSRIEINVSE